MIYNTIESIPENSIIPHWYMYPPKGYFTDTTDENWVQEKYKEELGKIKGPINIYIHIPFCSMKCSFCTLFTTISTDYDLYKNYVNTLLQEIDLITEYLSSENCSIQNLYIGGGTPSLLPKELLEKLVTTIRNRFTVNPQATFAVEFAPESTSNEIATNWRQVGFNRVSLGIQSFDDQVLNSMNRKSPSSNNISILKELRKIGFKSINIDLIYNTNDQDFTQLQKDLAISTELVNCITIHPLAIRRKTAYDISKGSDLGEDYYKRQSDFFEYAFNYFIGKGWSPTSSVTFSKNNIGQPIEESESVGIPTIGIGIGGRSYLKSIHTASINYQSKTRADEEINSYLKTIELKKFPIKTFSILDDEEILRRNIVLGIVGRGVQVSVINEIQNKIFENEILNIFKNLQALDLVYIDKDIFKLTQKGYFNSAKIGGLLSSKKIQKLFW